MRGGVSFSNGARASWWREVVLVALVLLAGEWATAQTLPTSVPATPANASITLPPPAPGKKAAGLQSLSNMFVHRAKPGAAAPAKQKEMKPSEAAHACLVTADELAQNGHRREAILLYERARTLDPAAPVSRYLAVLYDQEGLPQALAEYNRAIAAAPRDANLMNDLGWYYYKRGDLDKAEKWLKAALQHAPQDDRVWVNLGMVLGEQRRYRESFDAFSRAVGPGAAHSNLGMILARHGQLAQAQQELRQALSMDPELEQPRAVLAYLADSQQPPESRAVQQAVYHSPVR